MRNASGQQGEDERQWKKKKRKGTQPTTFFFSTYNVFSINRVTRKIHVATTKAKNCRKQRAARAITWRWGTLGR